MQVIANQMIEKRRILSTAFKNRPAQQDTQAAPGLDQAGSTQFRVGVPGNEKQRISVVSPFRLLLVRPFPVDGQQKPPRSRYRSLSGAVIVLHFFTPNPRQNDESESTSFVLSE
jgi:hypothetical protein